MVNPDKPGTGDMRNRELRRQLAELSALHAETETLKAGREAVQGAIALMRRLCVELTAANARADAAEARVAELEGHLTGDIQAVTDDGQQHRIRRGNWRPYPKSLE